MFTTRQWRITKFTTPTGLALALSKRAGLCSFSGALWLVAKNAGITLVADALVLLVAAEGGVDTRNLFRAEFSKVA